MKKIFKNNSGLASLIAVIVISTAAISIALSVALGGITELQTGLFVNNSAVARNYAEACAEEAYFRLKRDESYTGSTLNFSNDSCTVAVSGSGVSRTFTVEGIFDRFTRNLNTNVTLRKNVSLTSEGIDLTLWE
jgi:hypothetical protein